MLTFVKVALYYSITKKILYKLIFGPTNLYKHELIPVQNIKIKLFLLLSQGWHTLQVNNFSIFILVSRNFTYLNKSYCAIVESQQYKATKKQYIRNTNIPNLYPFTPLCKIELLDISSYQV